MQTNRSSDVSTLPAPLQKFVMEAALGVGAGTLLLGLAAGRSLVKALQDVGSLSEELFRGDRLPILHLPSPNPEQVLDPTSPE